MTLSAASAAAVDAHADVSALRFSHSGDRLAVAHTDGSASVYAVVRAGGEARLEARLEAQLRIAGAHAKGVSDICWTPDGARLVTASDDHTLVVHDSKSGAAIARLVGHASFVFCCAASPSGSLVASGAYDESVRLWDARAAPNSPAGQSDASPVRLDAQRVLSAHADPVTGVAFSPDGSVLATCGYDGLVRLWDVDDCAGTRCLRTLVAGRESESAPLAGCGGVSFSPNGRYVLVSCLDGAVRLFPTTPAAGAGGADAAAVRTFRGHANARYSMPAAMVRLAGGRQLVLACSEGGAAGFVHVWDMQTASLVCVLPASGDGASGDGDAPRFAALAVTPDGLVASSRGGRLFLHVLS